LTPSILGPKLAAVKIIAPHFSKSPKFTTRKEFMDLEEVFQLAFMAPSFVGFHSFFYTNRPNKY
jgi:hypothetical protein